MAMHLRAALVALPLVLALASQPAEAATCDGPLGRSDVIECAIAQSLLVRQARQELKVIAGRRIAAGILLPSNPGISALVAQRVATGSQANANAINWYLTLSQEIEIAGQRGARLDVVDAETAAQVRRVAVNEQEQAALAASTYFQVLALQEALVLTNEVGETAERLDVFAAARVKESLLAPLDADLFRAESVRVRLLQQDAVRRLAEAKIRLATLLGRDPAAPPLEVVGALEPPVAPGESLRALIDRALTLRGELAAAEAERQALQAQLAVWKRSRAPNLTLSFTAQNDGFSERVLGGGLSLPIPLPAPLGRTLRGEIVETNARLEQAHTSLDLVRRQVSAEVAQSFLTLQSRRAALALFSDDLVTRARGDLASLREGIATRQLSVREALLAQRSLLELLLSRIEARASYAQAWVELNRAAGLPFLGVSR